MAQSDGKRPRQDNGLPSENDDATGGDGGDTLSSILAAMQPHFDVQNKTVAETCAASQQATMANVASNVDNKVNQVLAQVKHVDSKVEQMHVVQSEQGVKIKALEQDMAKMSKQLELAGKNSLSREEIDSDQFDRPANVEILRISSKRFVNKSAVEEAFTPWLVDTCGIEAGMWKITGNDSGREFIIRFQSNLLANARLVKKAMGCLKNDQGEFHTFVAIRADKSKEYMRVDRDENNQTRTQRRMAACLIKVVKEIHPTVEEIHTRKDFKKGRVSVFVGGDGLCTMVPKSTTITRDAFMWNLPKVTELKFDREALIDRVMPMFERPEDNIEWCL